MEKDVEILSADGGQETIVVLMDEDDTNQPKPQLPTPPETSNTVNIPQLSLDPHGLIKVTSDDIASQEQESGSTEPMEPENSTSREEKDTGESGLSQELADSCSKEHDIMENSSGYTGIENLVDANGPICQDTSECPIDRSSDVIHVEQDPLNTEIRKLVISQCLQMVNPDVEDNTADLVTPNLDMMQGDNLSSKSSPSKEITNEQISQEMDIISDCNAINAHETTIQHIPKIVDVEEVEEPSPSNCMVTETSMKQNAEIMDFQQPALNTSSIRIADGDRRQNTDIVLTQVPDVTIHHDYTGAVSSTQILPCQTEACSVPGVCSICQSILTQTHRPVIIPSEVPANAYPANSAMDRILHGSINPQLIQGCIVTSTEGRNSEITQYLILQEPEGAPSSYPLTVSPVAVKERSPSRSSGAPELVPDLEALEGMMEVVVVQQYKCKMCQYKSTSKSTLLRHVKERHIQSANKDEKTVRKLVRPRDEEDEEEDDIIDAGAIDDPNDDSDYSPGEDATRSQQFESPMGALAKERPRRRPGRPRKIPRSQAPEMNIGPPQLSIMNEPVEINVILSDFENKHPPSCSPQEEQKLICRPRGRPPKHFRGRKYHRYRSRRYYKPPNKPLLRPFICRVCGSRFLTQEDYSFHINSHDSNDPQMFKCQQCSYQCRRWSSLKEHMFNHQGNKPHKCDQCNYTSVYKKDVIRHSAVHQQERKKKCLMIAKNISYPCPVCNRVYTMQKRLTQHMKTHSTEKPHMCDKCGKAFKKRYTFKNHLLTHLHCIEENRYKCEFCEYMCEDRKQLLNHQLTHMNDKPFKCSQCKYHTFRQDFLLTHQATKHAAGKPFACEYCHFTTKHKKNLRLHVKCRHAQLYQEWVQRHPEEAPCRRRPFFSPQQIEQLKQQHEQPMVQIPATQEAEEPPSELTYHMLHHPTQDGGQVQNTLEAATIIYEQGGEGDELATQAALDLLLNMSAQRDGPGGPLQVAVVKSAACIDGREPEASSQEPQMAQVLTLHMDERQVTEVQDAGYGETDMPEAGYEGTVQQITINTAFTTAEYSLINADNMQTPLCSENDAPPKSPHMLLAENGKDKHALHKSQQLQNSSDQPPPTTKKFSCKICNSSFWGRAEMESHKRAHVEGGRGFKCPDCGNFFAETWDEVRDHMTLHSDLRPHRCNQCSFASRNKKDLSRHAMTHTNHRPHTCHLCGQRFNRKGHLKFHIERLHTGANVEQPQRAELTSVPGLDEEHIFLAQEETVSNQEDTAYIQEITTADGQTLQQLVTADNQVQYIISQDGVPHLIPQEYVVLPEGHHIQVQDGQITHIQYEPGGPFIQDPQQIHFVPMSPTQQLLTQEQLEAAAHSAVTAVADAAMAQTVYTAETEAALQQEIQYDVITLAE